MEIKEKIMFIKGFRGVRGLGAYVARTPQDWKIDNWIGQPVGGGLQTVSSGGVIPGISTAAEVGGGLGLLALAAAAWWYFRK